jgi:hypothetical protein
MAFDSTVVVSSTDEAVPAPSPAVPETPEAAPESTTTRARDEQGRFIAEPETPPAEAAAAPAEGEIPAVEGEVPAEPPAEPGAEPPAKKGSPQARINQAVYKQREAERRMAAVEAELQALKAKLAPESAPTPAATPQKADGPPREEDFEKWEDYTKASVVYEARQEFLRLQKEEKDAAAAAARDAEFKTVLAAHTKRVEKGRAAHADWEDVVGNPDIKTSPPMEDAILYSPVGEEVMYYLGKNPDDAARIYALPPALALKEMGKIEARVEAALVKPGPTSRGPAVRTPPPIVPVGGGSHISTLDPEQMTPLEYHRWRNEQRATRY